MKQTLFLLAASIVIGAIFGFPLQAQQEAPADRTYDLLITGGQLLDGSGNPWFYGDIGIRNGTIAAVGRLSGARADRTIDAKGKAVVPGFIDLHSHADRGLSSDDPRRRAALNLVSQGITTVLVNPDGGGSWPIGEQRDALKRLGVGPNVALMVGHNRVRRHVLGDDFKRPATAEEIARMRELVRRGMQEGAFGMSAGLEYVPGIWSTTEEVVALAEEIVPFGGVYIAHQRAESSDPDWYLPSEGERALPSLLDAVRETIHIGEQTGATVVASHIKAMGAHYWGTSRAVIRLISQARARGVDVWADQYPYHSTGGDGQVLLIPAWALGIDSLSGRRTRQDTPVDYAAALRRTMSDPEKAKKVRLDMQHEMTRRGGPESILVMDHPDSSFVGKNLAELAAARGITPERMAFELQYEGDRNRPGGARLRGFSVWEEDLKALMAQPWTATSTDAGIALPDDGPVHARFYGSYPRKLHRYALEGKVISLEDAVRSSTSLPAQILGLRDRGLIREGLRADLVVLDLKGLRDKATFFEPHQYSSGVEHVLVNGRFVVEQGEPTGILSGVVLSPRESRRLP